jgi:hypothetical protein
MWIVVMAGVAVLGIAAAAPGALPSRQISAGSRNDGSRSTVPIRRATPSKLFSRGTFVASDSFGSSSYTTSLGYTFPTCVAVLPGQAIVSRKALSSNASMS